MFRFDDVQCPACGSGLGKPDRNRIATCRSCGKEYRIEDEIPILLTDPSLDTALDLDIYEATKPPSPERSANAYKHYKSVLAARGLKGGIGVEIGAGTGNLSYSLVHEAPFDHLYLSDISMRFLTRLRKWVPEAKGKTVDFMIFDASNLPFRSGSVRAVFGHSVLHHLLEYEAVLKDVHRVLEPGGVAIFGEPILNFHAVLAFVSDMIGKTNDRLGLVEFTEDETKVVRGVSRQAPVTAHRMRSARQELAAQEDKHMFLVEDIRAVSGQIGFSEFAYRNAYDLSRMGGAIKQAMAVRFTRFGGDPAKLNEFDFIFESVTQTIGETFGSNAYCEFGFLTFVK